MFDMPQNQTKPNQIYIYIYIYIYIERERERERENGDLALNDLHWLMCHKTIPN